MLRTHFAIFLPSAERSLAVILSGLRASLLFRYTTAFFFFLQQNHQFYLVIVLASYCIFFVTQSFSAVFFLLDWYSFLQCSFQVSADSSFLSSFLMVKASILNYLSKHSSYFILFLGIW